MTGPEDQTSSEPATPSGSGDGEPPTAPSGGSPTSSNPEGGDGEASPSGKEAHVRLPVAERARMRAAIMTRTKALGLSWDSETQAWFAARYGGPWSTLTDDDVVTLYNALFVPDGSRIEKEAAAARFVKAVKAVAA